MICFRFTDVIEGFAFAFDGRLMLWSTYDNFCSFFDFVLDGRLLANDFIVDVFLFNDFSFSTFRRFLGRCLDFFKARLRVFVRCTYGCTYGGVTLIGDRD